MLTCFPGGEKLKLVVKALLKATEEGDVLCPGWNLGNPANSAAPHSPLVVPLLVSTMALRVD